MSRQGMRLSRAEVDRVVSLALARPDLNPVGLSEISGVSVCRVRKLLRREDVPMPAMRRRTNMATIAAAAFRAARTEGLTYASMAERFNIAPTTVRRLVEKFNLPPRSCGPRPHRARDAEAEAPARRVHLAQGDAAPVPRLPPTAFWTTERDVLVAKTGGAREDPGSRNRSQATRITARWHLIRGGRG